MKFSHVIEGDLDTIFSNAVAATIPKWLSQTSEVDVILSPVNIGP
jgi:hypothetical protein